MRETCNKIYRKQYIQLRDIFITLFLESHDIYYLNIFIMIKLLYHLYIEHEIYYLSYFKNKTNINDNLFIKIAINDWDDFITFDEKIR